MGEQSGKRRNKFVSIHYFACDSFYPLEEASGGAVLEC